MPESVYIETTIPSYLAAFPSLKPLDAVHQRATQEWWMMHRSRYDLFTSEVVWEECSKGDPMMVRERRKLLEGIEELKITPEVVALAKAFLVSGVVPAKAKTDALHIALASVHFLDYLVTWNCTHIANPHIQARLRKVAWEHGYDLPTLCTPEALTYGDLDLPNE